jgi:hypothetical protein
MDGGVGMELVKKVAVEDYLAAGGKLTDPDTKIEAFDALLLAQALEYEMGRALERGQTHVRINMGLIDARALARFLRRGDLLGA